MLFLGLSVIRSKDRKFLIEGGCTVGVNRLELFFALKEVRGRLGVDRMY